MYFRAFFCSFTLFNGSIYHKMKKSFSRIVLALSLITAGAVALYMLLARIHYWQIGFLYDELYSMATADPNYSLGFIWREFLTKDINPPLYNILLYGWNHFFDMTPASMRVLSLLPGLAIIPLSYFWAPSHWPKLKKFIFLTLTTGCNTFAIFCFYIRSYSWAILSVYLFSLAALHITQKLEEKENPSQKLWAVFFVSGLAGAYLHFFSAGIFFITALILFGYAYYYKYCAKTVFWGTALCFLLWTPWLVITYQVMSAPSASWWYSVPLARVSWDILQYLFGSPLVLAVLLVFAILGVVSLLHTQGKKLLLQADIVFALGQICLLIAVVFGVSFKYNLWMDRYFAILMPAFILLITIFIFHLYQRQKILIILLPLLLTAWCGEYMQMDFKYTREFTGLKDAFAFVANELKSERVFVDMAKTGYTHKVFMRMLQYYVPQGKTLQIIPLTKQSVKQAFKEPKPPVLLPLCTQMHIMQAGLDYDMEEDGEPYVFGKDVCILTVHPVGGNAQ